ncbi:MAG: hypothetical protein V9H26_08340 [Verrucomicrobiota bacterium]
MKNKLFHIALALLILARPVHAENPTNPAPPWLAVMTYNLRYASPTPPNAWPQRRPLMRELIQQVAPDVMGTQEGSVRPNQGSCHRSARLRVDRHGPRRWQSGRVHGGILPQDPP